MSRTCTYTSCLAALCLLLAGTLRAQNVPATPGSVAAVPVAVPAAYNTTIVNYIRTWEPAMPSTDVAQIINSSRTVKEVRQSTQYFDGLGRPLQTVAKGMSKNGNDVVAPVVYDALGREQYKYLPYVPNAKDGNFKTDPFNSQRAFYADNTLNPGAKNETIYYSQTDFEASPLNRVSKIYAPGNSWAKTGGNHPVQQQYLVNALTDSVRSWSMTGNTPTSATLYGAGQLYKNITIDENGYQQIVYKDKSDLVILKKVQLATTPGNGHMGWLCTYYVYDDWNNLRFVIPPLAVEKITTTWNVAPLAAELCFEYRYDGRNRMTFKKIPGADSTDMVYDVRDRLVFVQDGQLRNTGSGQWLTTFYDALNRPVQTALYKSNIRREALQTSMNNALANGSTSYTFPGISELVVNQHDRDKYIATNNIRIEPGFETGASTEMEAFINPSLTGEVATVPVSNPLPGIAAADLIPLTYTFYDHYNYPGVQAAVTADNNKPQADGNPYAMPTIASNQTFGLVTGTKVRILDTDQWLTTTTYYNDQAKVLQTISDNAAGGKETLTFLYDFNGKVLSTYQRHTHPASSATPQTTLLTMMGYDDAGRLKTIKKRVNDNESLERTIATNDYDELGQMKTKQLGIQKNSPPLEQLSYEYNIRGWLKSINKDYLNNGGSGAHFGQELSYDNGFRDKSFNGNISGIRWKGWNDPLPRAYGYNYDASNRLSQADFSQQDAGSTAWSQHKINYSVPWINYDANGNITKMAQKGMDGTSIVPLDQLTYTYLPNSNKLATVYDTSGVTTTLGDFKNGKNTGNDYDYDRNGNLTKDLNKAISSIAYNHLNLPVLITMDNKGTVAYQYDASGNKVKKIVTDKTRSPFTTTTTSYINGFVYQNDTLQFFGHEEGRIRLAYKAGQAPAYVYDYFVKDHLNNTRLVLTEQRDFSIYAATMETPAAAKESQFFSNIDDTRVPKPVGYPADDAATTQNESVARLTAKNGGKKIGPSIVLRVMAGDSIQIGTKAFYKSTGPQDKNTAGLPAENMLAALVQAFGGTAAEAGAHDMAANGNQTPFNTNFYNKDYQRLKDKEPNRQQQDRPKAYLNFVLFDDQFNLVEENSGVKQVKAEPDQLQTLAVDKMPVKKSGFLYVYTSNETPQEVFFDNIVLGVTNGPVLEETHYYPFGLTMAGLSSSILKGTAYPENKIKYNGKELQRNEFGDGVGLEWYDYGARMQDPQIGRWHTQDKYAEVYISLSPYQYTANNPVKIIDEGGHLLRDKDGNIIATSTGNKYVRNDEITRQDGNTYRVSASFKEVLIYTDQGTPVRALQMVSQYVEQQNADKSFSPTTAAPVDACQNCHGTTFAEGKLVIVDGSDANESINTILREDGYTSEGVSINNADAFVMSYGGVDYHSGKINKDGSATIDHDLGKVKQSTLDNDKKVNSYQPGTRTTLYEKQTPNKQVNTTAGKVSNGVRTVSQQEATKVRKDNKLKTTDKAVGTFRRTAYELSN
ncbi:DUF6443 domain-containing protein [Chitinophaga nivalis]|uniref:DUF6443 domain-containing protein n=1 Tax=Chitinophaga nivalis TaxID=2991709 RepID=A0ABT3IGA6_9BACT|nr:DUF6443 domain-containing protein [Chitinophaga nivalis]MCW3467306.1 DUF6443 domain-containing protein [Chitinophaga nivalis]MCW3483002.1 DUF6443 domain-containing protein [Chitinophaga nivalis]